MTISIYAPHLHNGDDSYSDTTGTGTSTWYYDKDGEHWYRYTVDFSYNGSIVGRMYYCETATLTYDGSWLSGLGASVGSGSATVSVSGTNVNVSNVTANTVVNLTGSSAQFVPTFVLNETQYANYRLFTGNTITVEMEGETKEYNVFISNLSAAKAEGGEIISDDLNDTIQFIAQIIPSVIVMRHTHQARGQLRLSQPDHHGGSVHKLAVVGLQFTESAYTQRPRADDDGDALVCVEVCDEIGRHQLALLVW